MLVIGVVAAAAIGGTIAYFSDKEVSTGNVMVAGTIDLKVDHTKQTYNGVDCKTCDVKIVSDTDNMVVDRDGVSMSVPAVLVTNINSRWTADVGNPNAKWIWATDPTRAEDTYGTKYTFSKKFDWYGPFDGASMSFSVGSDNSVVVYLNGAKIGENTSEFGYQTPVTVSFTPAQGENELKFVVTNWNQSHDPASNPGGLKYAMTIDGKCEGDYFKTHCQLWNLTNLKDQKFWMFDDIKPGDYGMNLISLHPTTNDSKVCSYVMNTQGTLGNGINLFVWKDTNGNGTYETGEATIYNGVASGFVGKQFEGTIIGNSTAFMGIAWCAGSAEGAEGVAKGNVALCSPATMGNEYQGTNFNADFGFYAVQARHNDQFVCPEALPVQEVR